MKKFFTLVAAASMVIAANAGTKVLYVQDFEGVTEAAQAGWVSPSNAGALKIGSDEFGQFLSIEHGGSNGRTYYVAWGADIFGENASMLEDGKYTITLDYCPTHNLADPKQSNAALTIMNNIRGVDNQPFNGRWDAKAPGEGQKAEGYLFDINQTPREEEVVGSIQFMVNGDANDLILLTPQWYTITLNVDVEARTVEYEIATLLGEVVTSGERTVPELDYDETPITMYTEGIWVMGARCQSTYLIDNIKVSCESDQDVANKPSCALTRLGKDAEGNVNLNLRAYTINFLEGEALHVLGTEGNEDVISYFDCDGAYIYETTTSGILTCWTTCGDATSEAVETEVDCSPCVLPEATASIISVSAGYAKTYTLTVSNVDVPLSPVIFISYVYEDNDGNVTTGDELGSGAKVSVEKAGTFTITTKAFGYQESTITVKNDVEFSLKAKTDFVHMTPEEIVAKKFVKEDDLNSSTTSGEGNWTARRGMFYYDANTAHVDEESGETVYDAVYPFGFVSEDDTEHVIHRYKLLCSVLQENDYYKEVFPGLEVWNDFNMQWKQSIGLIVNTMKKGDDEDGDGMAKAGTVNVKVPALAATDFVVVKKISNYGRDMEHPICNSPEEYDLYDLANVSEVYAAAEETEVPEGAEEAVGTGVYSVTFALYRIDTALAGVEVYAAGESGIENVVVDEFKSVDNAWYTIDGIRLDTPNHSGLYIHQGKKVYIRK